MGTFWRKIFFNENNPKHLFRETDANFIENLQEEMQIGDYRGKYHNHPEIKKEFVEVGFNFTPKQCM